MCKQSAKWILHSKKGGHFIRLLLEQNINKTGFNDPVPYFIQEECDGWKAKLTENMMQTFIMDLITFIGKFLALLRFWPAQKTHILKSTCHCLYLNVITESVKLCLRQD